MKIRRAYVDGRFGQVHYREAGSSSDAPLYLLHATAYSGQTFVPLMELLAHQRRVIALDTPGYGGSDGPPAMIDLAHYAQAIAEAIQATRPDTRPVDIFGHHTGAMIAVELAAQFPELVRRMALIGIPFFEGTDKAVWRNRLVQEHALGESLDQFRHRWEYHVAYRPIGMPLTRAFDNFVDELRVWPQDWWAHKALFDYDARPRFAKVACPVKVIDLEIPLGPYSRAAAALMPEAVLHKLPEVSVAPLDLGVGLIAPVIADFMDGFA
jgi:pimeloyl-ACP methyl ester carboxylesterase